MSAFQSLVPRQPVSLETIHDILGSLVARYRQEEVLTAVLQIPAREAKLRPIPGWVTSALSEAYRAKGIQELYSHQAATSDLVRDVGRDRTHDPAFGRKALVRVTQRIANTMDSRAQAEDEGVQNPHPQLHGKRAPIFVRRTDRDCPSTGAFRMTPVSQPHLRPAAAASSSLPSPSSFPLPRVPLCGSQPSNCSHRDREPCRNDRPRTCP